MLEIPGTDTIADWPERRVRDELTARLGVPGRLEDVPLREFSLLDLRVRVIEPMQQDRLFLAGDAAHLITPAGGKGMNLAIQGRGELAHGLRQGWITALQNDPQFAQWFAHAYAGVDPP